MQDIQPLEARPKKVNFEVKELSGAEARTQEPSEKVKVKFEKFVQLVATHDFEDVMQRHKEDDIILSTNLLTDLANAHEEVPEPRRNLVPIMFAVGITLGILATYLVIRV